MGAWMLSIPLAAQVVATKQGEVTFTSHVPLHTFSGVSQELVGSINFADGTVDFYVDLASLNTGIGKRDKDMRTTLEVKKYPFAEFFGSLVKPVDQNSLASQPVEVKGSFGLHGVKEEITVRGTLQRTGSSWQLDASWSLNLSDYNITPPKLLVMKVDERQEISIHAILSSDPK